MKTPDKKAGDAKKPERRAQGQPDKADKSKVEELSNDSQKQVRGGGAFNAPESQNMTVRADQPWNPNAPMADNNISAEGAPMYNSGLNMTENNITR